MKKKRIQLSLFPTGYCSECNKKLNHSGVTCESCVDEWLDNIELEGKKVFKLLK